MKRAARSENLTRALLRHIHSGRELSPGRQRTKCIAARVLIFAFPRPAMTPVKKPAPLRHGAAVHELCVYQPSSTETPWQRLFKIGGSVSLAYT